MQKKYEKLKKKNLKDKESYYQKIAEKVAPEGLELIKRIDDMRERNLKAAIGFPGENFRQAHTCFWDFATAFLNGKIKEKFSKDKDTKTYPIIVTSFKPHKTIEKEIESQKELLSDTGYTMLKDIWYKDTPFFFGLLKALLSTKEDIFASNFFVAHYNLYLKVVTEHLKHSEKIGRA